MEKINKKKLKIMIVEDEEDILILYKDFLSCKGHDVTTTYLNGDAMIKDIDKVKSEIYLIDYRLPGNKNGIEVAIEILNKFPAAPILFITAYENLQKEISKNSIFYDKNVQVILKPVKLDKIEDAMVNLVNKMQIK
jgi:DNA-binding NtrC family response regulator